MKTENFVYETAVSDLVKKLPNLEKHSYTTLDKLIHKVAAKHKVNDKILQDLFIKRYHKTPDEWIKNKLDETDSDINVEEEIHKFVDWASNVLHLKTKPQFEFSLDTEEAQDNHHTGAHQHGTNKVWVYIKNRNLIDILRTVFHELVHVRQGELGMIKPGDSYPGSAIEVMADALAGKYIKIYGEKNHHIFQ